MSTFFTADQHFEHSEIINHCHRPFRSLQQMNNTLIRNYNSVIDHEDEVYIIGDFSFRPPAAKQLLRNIAQKLKGRKHLILGNHDRLDPFDYVEMGFISVHTALKVDEFILCHDPAAFCAVTPIPLLCGHVHTLFKRVRNVLNVGVDVWDFTPVSIEQVRQELANAEEEETPAEA